MRPSEYMRTADIAPRKNAMNNRQTRTISLGYMVFNSFPIK